MSTAQAAAQPIGREFLADFMSRWDAAWNEHRADDLLALMTEDVEYEDSGWPRTMRGHADVREFLDFLWRAFPDMRFETVAGPYLDPGGPRASFHWRGTATNTGPIEPPGIPPTGRRLEFYGADFQEYRDGKVARLRIVFDMAGLLGQLGPLPGAG